MLAHMKKELLKTSLILTAAAIFTGCASTMDHRSAGYSDVTGPANALAFTTVTDAKELGKWTGNKFLFHSLRSIDTYTFQVPDTTAYATAGRFDRDLGPARDVIVQDTRAGEVTYPRAVGSAPPAFRPYQSETRSYRVIQYRPGHSAR
jgi:hypothetical protein